MPVETGSPRSCRATSTSRAVAGLGVRAAPDGARFRATLDGASQALVLAIALFSEPSSPLPSREGLRATRTPAQNALAHLGPWLASGRPSALLGERPGELQPAGTVCSPAATSGPQLVRQRHPRAGDAC